MNSRINIQFKVCEKVECGTWLQCRVQFVKVSELDDDESGVIRIELGAHEERIHPKMMNPDEIVSGDPMIILALTGTDFYIEKHEYEEIVPPFPYPKPYSSCCLAPVRTAIDIETANHTILSVKHKVARDLDSWLPGGSYLESFGYKQGCLIISIIDDWANQIDLEFLGSDWFEVYPGITDEPTFLASICQDQHYVQVKASFNSVVMQAAFISLIRHPEIPNRGGFVTY